LFLTPLLAIKSENNKKNIVFPLFKEENIEKIVDSIETITKEKFISCQTQNFDRIKKIIKINEKDESSVFVDSKNRVGLINKYVKSIGEVVFGKEDCLRMYFDIN
jgi:mevalonate kinase